MAKLHHVPEEDAVSTVTHPGWEMRQEGGFYGHSFV